jgi:hypothetical protein
MTHNVFQTAIADYDLMTDTLTATVYIARTCLDPEIELDRHDTLENFEIVADFANRQFTIRDVENASADCEPHYLPSVMTAFLRAFDVERADELFRFYVEIA